MRRIGRTPRSGSQEQIRKQGNGRWRLGARFIGKPSARQACKIFPMTRSLLLVVASVATAALTPQLAAQDLGKARQPAIVTAASRLAPAVVRVNALRRERRLAHDPFEQSFTPRGAEQVEEAH